MKTITLGLVSLALAWLGASCIGGELRLPQGASRVPEDQVQVLAYEHSSGIEERRRAVLRSEAEWADFWTQLHQGRSPVPERPPVDFAQAMVIVAAMGTRPTGGYDIEVEAVGRSGAAYHVIVRETAPGRNCMTTQALTQPVAALRVPRSDGTVSFIERSETERC
jgi:hypothetical protein